MWVQNEQGVQFLLEKKHEQAMALVKRTEADKEALQTTIRANKRLQATIVRRLEEQEDASSGVPKNVQQAYMDLVMKEMDKEKE